MESHPFNDFIITLDREGSNKFSKVSFPVRYGLFSEIKTPDTIFQFNLNGEIKYIQGIDRGWPHPAEWLKRTTGNDWLYYSAGDYKDIYDYFGEYYFPYLSYPSNSILDGDPLRADSVVRAMKSLRTLRTKINTVTLHPMPESLKDFLIGVMRHDEEILARRAEQLHRLLGGQVTVLPPDSRHVDYEVIPVMVADGCLYRCGFCRVKTGQDFAPRRAEDVVNQIKSLKQFYGRDLHNYNAVFLGQHDALLAGREILELAAAKAYKLFEFDRSYLKGSFLFLFGSIDSILRSEEKLFESLHRLPFSTFINVGLESNDRATLEWLKKPVSVEQVREAFLRISDINRKYEKIEVTANFVFGKDLPATHLPSLFELIGDTGLSSSKGAVYLSPLMEEGVRDKEGKRKLLKEFLNLKTRSRLPLFLYLIQRL